MDIDAVATEHNPLLPVEASGSISDKMTSLGITQDWIKPYLYPVAKDRQGNQKFDMSAVGINEIGARLGISIESIRTAHEDSQTITLEACAVNPQGIRAYGVATEKKSDRYYLQKAYSKAQRNARKQLIPMAFIQGVVQELFGESATYDAEDGDSNKIQDLETRLAKGRAIFSEQQARITTLEEYIKSHNLPLPEAVDAEGEEVNANGHAEEEQRAAEEDDDDIPFS